MSESGELSSCGRSFVHSMLHAHREMQAAYSLGMHASSSARRCLPLPFGEFKSVHVKQWANACERVSDFVGIGHGASVHAVIAWGMLSDKRTNNTWHVCRRWSTTAHRVSMSASGSHHASLHGGACTADASGCAGVLAAACAATPRMSARARTVTEARFGTAGSSVTIVQHQVLLMISSHKRRKVFRT